jgi:uncharacterized protein
VIDATSSYVLVVIFVATLVRSTIGFGEALVAVPLLALRIPVSVATPLAVAMSVLVAATIIVQDWRHVELRSAGWLTGSSLFGIPLGIGLLTQASDHIVRLILGVVIAGFAAYSLSGAGRVHLESDKRRWLLGAGFCSGILGGAFGMNGPPLAVYGALRRWSPQRFRATLQGYFLVASLVGLIGFAIAGLWRPVVTHYLLLSLPGALVAVLAGRWCNSRLRGDRFYRLVYAGLLVIGAVLIGRAMGRG